MSAGMDTPIDPLTPSNGILRSLPSSQTAQQTLLEESEKLTKISNNLNEIEIIRLNLIPLLLEIIENIKKGEIQPKNVDNACGRIRVRLNKLRTIVNEITNDLADDIGIKNEETKGANSNKELEIENEIIVAEQEGIMAKRKVLYEFVKNVEQYMGPL